MPFGFIPFVPGNVRDPAQVQTMFDQYQGWLNGQIIINDVQNAGVKRHNIFKPETYGFPTNGMLGEFNRLLARNVTGDQQDHWYKVRRIDINPQVADKDQGVKLLDGLGATLDLTGMPAGVVTIRARWSAEAHNNDYTNPREAGHFVLKYRRRDSRLTSTIAASRRQLVCFSNPVAWKDPPRHQQSEFYTQGRFVASPVAYDIWLEYNASTAYSSITHVSVGARALRVSYTRGA